MNLPAVRPNRDRALELIERSRAPAVAKPIVSASVASAAGSLAERVTGALEEIATRGGRGSAVIEAVHKGADGSALALSVRIDVAGRDR